MDETCPICGPDHPHDKHEDNSYGGCSRCRTYVPHSFEEYEGVAFPCAVVRLEVVKNILDEMRTYASHTPFCAFQPIYDGFKKRATCNCGFDNLLEDYEKIRE